MALPDIDKPPPGVVKPVVTAACSPPALPWTPGSSDRIWSALWFARGSSSICFRSTPYWIVDEAFCTSGASALTTISEEVLPTVRLKSSATVPEPSTVIGSRISFLNPALSSVRR